MSNRFMVDDAGTLIDMQTRDMFDIVEEIVDLLNELHKENEQLQLLNKYLIELLEKNGATVEIEKVKMNE